MAITSPRGSPRILPSTSSSGGGAAPHANGDAEGTAS